VQEALARPEGLTFRGMRNLRSEIGELADKSFADTNMAQGPLKRLYGALTQDMQFAISQPASRGGGGKAGLAAFQAANQGYEELKVNARKLAGIVGKDGDAPAGTVIERLKALAGSKGGSDINRLRIARASVGKDAWDSVASHIVSQLGETKNGFSIAHFRTNYLKLSEEGRDALFGSTGKQQLKESLDRLSVIGQGAEQLQRLANSSGSARIANIIATGGLIGTGFLHPAAFLTLLGGGATSFAIAKTLARPVAAKALADAGEAALRAAANPQSQAALQHYGVLISQLARVGGPELAAELKPEE
jgi:hypothetical protein